MPQITIIKLDQLKHKPQERYELVGAALIGVEHVASIIRMAELGPELKAEFFLELTQTGEQQYEAINETSWPTFEAASADLVVQFAAK